MSRAKAGRLLFVYYARGFGSSGMTAGRNMWSRLLRDTLFSIDPFVNLIVALESIFFIAECYGWVPIYLGYMIGIKTVNIPVSQVTDSFFHLGVSTRSCGLDAKSRNVDSDLYCLTQWS